jgi:hypothetical protein
VVRATAVGIGTTYLKSYVFRSCDNCLCTLSQERFYTFDLGNDSVCAICCNTSIHCRGNVITEPLSRNGRVSEILRLLGVMSQYIFLF